MDESPRFSLEQRLHEGQNSIIFRGLREDDQTSVVIKVLKGEYPSPQALRQLRREYATLRELDLPGVIRAYSLELYGNGLALVMEDGGGVPLSDLIHGEALPLRRALEVGLALAETLAQLHQRSIIHKDIKPHNILVNRSTGDVKLIDFGIATHLTHETPRVASPDTLEGTLLYMSPEQSGRMNRVVDPRTDLYSLGVTLYEMLTGTVPFTASDAMELVHSHIARTPTPPRTRTPTVPAVVSDIVVKLLAKAPEDRYQHAHGLAADLVRCLEEFDASGEISCFVLGQHDRADVLRIPQKLYGREADISALTAAFARTQDGRPELLLLSGGAGVGKSVLVHEVHKVISRSGGRFVAGKFDLLQRNVPFSAFAWAFGDLVRQLLTEAPNALEGWRARMQAAVGSSGQLVVDLVPELERILGRQPVLTPLRPTESQNRFGLVLQQFVRVFCLRASPLVIFLDDLQWADAATLSLLRLLLTDPEGGDLLLVGAYRDGEVDPGHPLRALVTQLRKDDVTVTERTLGPLDQASVRALLADTLTRAQPGATTPRDEDQRVDALSALLFEKTNGNPFFLTQFLVTLYQSGLLRFDHKSGEWTWDQAAIAAAPITENVVELMSNKLRQLPEATQQLLAIAACIGHEFDVVTLARIAQRGLGRVVEELWPALQAGMVMPLDANYRLLAADDVDEAAVSGEAPELVVSCRFLHDRVQQAALALQTPEALYEVHLRIGRNLKARQIGELRGDALFDVVRHFNAGAPRLTDPDERLELARANLAAARAAKRATAHAAGAAFAGVGVSLLPADAWDDEHELTFALHRERAECGYMSGRVTQADAEFEDLIARARSRLEQAELYGLRIMLLSSQGRFAEGLAASRTGLAQFGERLPETPDEIFAAFGAAYGAIEAHLVGRTADSLADAPAMSDPVQHAVLRLLNEAFGAAFVVDARLGSVVILRHVLLSLSHGHAELSAFGYATYGYLLVGPLGRPVDALGFGQLALQLLERFNSMEVASRVHFMVGFYIGHTRPLRDSLHHFEESRRLGLESGDFLYASQGALFHALADLRRGEELGAVRDEVTQGLALMVRTGDAMSTMQFVLLRNVVDALQHGRWWDGPLTGVNENEAAWLRGVDDSGLAIVRFLHHVTKLMVAALFEVHDEAVALIAAAEPLMLVAVGAPHTADLPFYAAITLAALHGASEDEHERESLMTQLLRHRAATAKWAELCPENEQHRLHIIDAEVARLRGQDLVALDEYDRAIEWARRNQCAHHEAIGNELCGRFHLLRGRAQIARVYLSQARYGFERWGALAKVRALDLKYPHLAARAETASPSAASSNRALITSSLSTTGNQGLDLNSVIKASQALTMEISIQPLLEKIIQIMVENAGARRGVLLLEQEGQLCLVAESSVDIGPFTLMQPLPLAEAGSVPVSIIHYVAHTSESVILEDATATGLFTTDPYVTARKMRSILCTPLVHQTKLIGVLYLENELLPCVFPESRLNTLQLIASQAAISIENANLYAHMERLVNKRTDELHRANQSLTASNAELDAFARTVAHDLKNPLGALVGDSEYLIEHLREIDPDELEKVVENIRRASQSATSIIEELLLLAGVRKQQVQISPLDMAAIIRQVEQRMAYMRREYQGELSLPTSWPTAMGYAPWIEEAWTNYISNGLKYGGSPPRLALGADEQADGTIRFWVRDDGPGIPEDTQALLFAEFSRLDVDRAEGHGLGLSIVRRIIERLGGHVGVQSRPGEGSVFYFSLPSARTASV